MFRDHCAAIPAVALCLVAAGTVSAAPQTFYGQDLGLGNNFRLPSHPIADAARDAFLASLAAGVPTETFEGIAATDAQLVPRNVSLTFGPQTALLSGPGLVMDLPAPSTANPVNGIPSGVYPISGTHAWLSSDDFSISFDRAQVALGFYGVDIGDFNGQLTLDLVHADQTTTRVLASSGVTNNGGSVQYFGVLSVDHPFVAVRFGNSAPVGYDGFVFDDLTIATAEQLAAPVPELPSGAMLFAGLAALAGMASRRGVIQR